MPTTPAGTQVQDRMQTLHLFSLSTSLHSPPFIIQQSYPFPIPTTTRSTHCPPIGGTARDPLAIVTSLCPCICSINNHSKIPRMGAAIIIMGEPNMVHCLRVLPNLVSSLQPTLCLIGYGFHRDFHALGMCSGTTDGRCAGLESHGFQSGEKLISVAQDC